MRVDSTLVFNRDDITKLTKEGQILYLPKELIRMLDNDSPLPIPIVFERMRKPRGDSIIEASDETAGPAQKLISAPKEKKEKTLPCVMGCGKMILNEYGMYKHLLAASQHKNNREAKKWIAEYHQRVKENRGGK